MQILSDTFVYPWVYDKIGVCVTIKVSRAFVYSVYLHFAHVMHVHIVILSAVILVVLIVGVNVTLHLHKKQIFIAVKPTLCYDFSGK